MARASEGPFRELTSGGVIDLLRHGCWASVPTGTIASLIDGGRVIEFPAGHTVYAEADAERLAIVLQGLLRVYMHASDGRQVTVRYVRRGDLLGGPAVVGGPAPVFVQAVASGAAFFFDIDRVNRLERFSVPCSTCPSAEVLGPSSVPRPLSRIRARSTDQGPQEGPGTKHQGPRTALHRFEKCSRRFKTRRQFVQRSDLVSRAVDT
jgi:CRP-like cAMP-binding protein